MSAQITFDQLPAAVAELNRKIDILLAQTGQPQPEPDRLMTVSELQSYLPEHPANQTIYGWSSRNIIPHEKHGKTLWFRKSSIDLWLANGRRS